MNRLRYLPILLLLAAVAPVEAADINGYSATYEAAVSNPPDCDIIIRSSGDSGWATLNNPSYRVICLAAGDYSSRGKIVLRASGTSSQKRWLRHVTSSAKPWRQPEVERAKLAGVVLEGGASHWIIHGITVDPDYADSGDGTIQFTQSSNVNNVIIDSVLIENGASANLVYLGRDVHHNWIQNSVLRNCRIRKGFDAGGVGMFGAKNNYIVNNEIYGCVKAIYISEHLAKGTVIENNDLYTPTTLYSDCNGRYNGSGPCSATESIIGTKNGGTAAEPVRMLHNRIWGNRKTDTSLCCNSGGSGSLAFIGGQNATADPATTGAKYTLFMNNVLMDSQIGIGSWWGGTHNNSYIGNLIYNVRRFLPGADSHAIATGMDNNSEFYLNSIIDSDVWISLGGFQNDVRCNVAVNSGGGRMSFRSGTQVENNVFYGTPPYATSSSAYMSYPSAADAQSGEFCFYRKLQTGPEKFCIPHAKPSPRSPHYLTCSESVGARPGIGINDDHPLY